MSNNIGKTNKLLLLHTAFINAPILSRERVCEECNWSIPTFYRKMQLRDMQDEKGKLSPALSNAEKDKISEVAIQVYRGLYEELSK